MKEIGGYFGFEELIKSEYYPDLLCFDTARSCLLYLIQKRKIQKVYLPEFMCDCVEIVLKRADIAYEFYKIDERFHPLFEGSLKQGEYLYVVNFYGQLTQLELSEYKKRFDQLIVDNTQAFFQPPVEGIDTFYTCRKFFGVPDGAYLSTDLSLDEEYPKRSAHDRISHILGRNEKSATEYYNAFIENEADFDTNEIHLVSDLSKNLLGAIPYEEVKAARTQNAAVLHKLLKKYNQLDYRPIEGTFSYPLLVAKGEGLRKHLIQHKIYVPLLWPNVIQDSVPTSLAYRYAMNILPIPCDQRYSEEDMRYIYRLIEEYQEA